MPSGMDCDGVIGVVDVLGPDQRMRYGRVVGVAEDGLFVDLLCPNRRREFAPYGSVFLPLPRSSVDKVLEKLQKSVSSSRRPGTSKDLAGFDARQRSTVPVELLVLETPLGPWIWLPGEMSGMLRALDGGAVVHWQSPDTGGSCTDYIPFYRIRPIWNAEKNGPLHYCVRPDKFIMGSVNLGKEFRSLPTGETKALIKKVNGYKPFILSDVFVAAFVKGQLEYIYERTASSKEDFALAFTRFRKKLLRIVTSPSDEDSWDAEMARILPAELWQEVFAHLDIVTQTKLRVVCTTWNRIMDAPALRSTLVLRDEYEKGGCSRFPYLAGIYHCLHPGTERVVIMQLGGDEGTSMGYVTKVCAMMRCVADQQTGIRLRTLLLHCISIGCRVYCAVDSTDAAECFIHHARRAKYSRHYWLDNFITKCCSGIPCNSIHLANCVAILFCQFPSVAPLAEDREIQMKMKIGTARLPLSGDIGCAAWDALEAALSMPNEEEIHALHERLTVDWIPRWFTVKNTRMKNAVSKVLCATQSLDPRPSSRYRGKKWCVEGLEDLQWEELSRIAVHFLLDLQKRFDELFPVEE